MYTNQLDKANHAPTGKRTKLLQAQVQRQPSTDMNAQT